MNALILGIQLVNLVLLIAAHHLIARAADQVPAANSRKHVLHGSS